MVVTSTGLTRRFEDLLKELVINKAMAAPTLQPKDKETAWLDLIQTFISGKDDCGVCLVRPSLLPDMPQTLAQAIWLQQSGIDIANNDPNGTDTLDDKRAKIQEKKRYMFAYACLQFGLKKRPELVNVLRGVPEPNAYLAWIALQNHMRPHAANRKIELLDKFNTIEQKLAVPIEQFNSEFNVLLAELQAYGAMIDGMMAAQKYIIAVRVPPQERALLGSSLNVGLQGLQAITSNWGMLNSQSNSHSSAEPHVKGYSADVDSEDEIQVEEEAL
jgi:hypothetical protein